MILPQNLDLQTTDFRKSAKYEAKIIAIIINTQLTHAMYWYTHNPITKYRSINPANIELSTVVCFYTSFISVKLFVYLNIAGFIIKI